MNRQKVKKGLYVKPDTEVIAMDPEGGLLLTASAGTVNGKSAYGGNTIFSNRQTPRTTAGNTSSNSTYSGNTIFNNRGN